MKKIVRLIAALGLISMVIAFAGCDMATEEDLLESTETEGGTGGKDNPENPATPGTGNSNSPLWVSFDGADMQVWDKTVKLTETKDGLEIKIGSLGWWGMCFCNKSDVGAENPECVTFDMSKVAKISFEAKASETAAMWISQSDANSIPQNEKVINLSTSFETKIYELSNPGTKDYGLFDIGGKKENNTTYKTNVVITIKNIKFLDSNGNETIPQRNTKK